MRQRAVQRTVRRAPTPDGVHARSPILDAIAADGCTADLETIHLDCDYDNPKIRRELTDAELPDHVIQRRRQPGNHRPGTITLELRCIVEATKQPAVERRAVPPQHLQPPRSVLSRGHRADRRQTARVQRPLLPWTRGRRDC